LKWSKQNDKIFLMIYYENLVCMKY